MIEEPIYHLIRPSLRQGYMDRTSKEVFTLYKFQVIICTLLRITICNKRALKNFGDKYP